jgi:two-component system LytT family sensor kinase
MNSKRLFGIRVGELFATLLFYLVFCMSYNVMMYYGHNLNLLGKTAVGFLLLGVMTIPVWYVTVRRLANFPLIKKILLQLIILPAFIMIWVFLFFPILKWMNIQRAPASETIWEIYTPTLFYIIQFCVFNLYDYYFRFQKQKETESALRQMALQSEINAMRAQMQPHFLFNTLNTICASVPRSEEKTRNLITKFADTIRYTLYNTEKELITLEEELNFIKTYLDLEQARFKDRFQVEYTIDKETLPFLIPPFLLQPIIENAIKHAVAPSTGFVLIKIHIYKKRDGIFLEINDTGPGYDGILTKQIFEKGIGLRNISQRLQKMYATDLIVKENSPSGLRFYFDLPDIHQNFAKSNIC